MCGISGYFTVNGLFNESDLRAMNNTLVHRGPDADGFFVEKNIGLGHRRLSIIDLSTTANQPMLSANGQFVIVYNGEVYNFKEIETELRKEKPQTALKTKSDTEVILEAFVHWGENFVQKLNGMFAITIYDRQTEALYLYRDRIGVKPLYYFWDTKNILFASELKALTKLRGKIPLSINKTAINEFLHLGYIPGPHSIYEKVFKLQSGYYLKLQKGNLTLNKYWDIEAKINPKTENNFENAKETLKSLIESSVNYRMISDVSFGTFLSGGIDSSIVTAVAQHLSDKPINTFSIGFNDKKHNEAGFAKQVADYLKTNHHEFIVNEQDALKLVSELPSVYDEPYADSSAIPTLLVSQLAGKHVKMTLSGDGGDELFMGYGAYKWAERLNNPFVNLLKKPISKGLSASGKYQKQKQLLEFENKQTIKSHIFSQEQGLFSRNEIRELLQPNYYTNFELDENVTTTPRRLSEAEQQALFDIRYYLKDDLLVKVDRATMRHSIETRVPLLDYRIVEFAINLSPELKIKNDEAKYLLKQVLYDYVPESFFTRPKQGFSIPLEKWLKTDLSYLIEEYLNESVIKKHNVVNFNSVESLKKEFAKQKNAYLYNRIWLLIVLHQWLETNQ